RLEVAPQGADAVDRRLQVEGHVGHAGASPRTGLDGRPRQQAENSHRRASRGRPVEQSAPPARPSRGWTLAPFTPSGWWPAVERATNAEVETKDRLHAAFGGNAGCTPRPGAPACPNVPNCC